MAGGQSQSSVLPASARYKSRSFLSKARTFQYEAQCIAWVAENYPGATFFTMVTNEQRFTAIFPRKANLGRSMQLAKDGFYVVNEEHLRQEEDGRARS